MRLRLHVLMLLMLLAAAGGRCARAQHFLADDPLRVDPDRLDMPAPYAVGAPGLYETIKQLVWRPGDYEGPAVNVNTLGEVPRSSWYANRHYRRPMSADELRRGPNTGAAPAAVGDWHVRSIERVGATVRLAVEDDEGRRYALQFDPPGHVGLATGAGAVAHRALYALGYHVPEVYVVEFPHVQLRPAEGSGIARSDLRAVLAHVPRSDGGQLRALAVRTPEGTPVGPFYFYGTRLDDANDIFPHEGRRELRGLRLVAAWLQLDDLGAEDTQAVVVREAGRQYVRHYLMALPWALGSGRRGPKERWAGHEPVLDAAGMAERVASLGLVGAPWTRIDFPDHPAVGHFEAEAFEPERWTPRVPNPAFRQMDAADAFWAARQIMHFSDADLAALVDAAQYADSSAARYVAETLARRRDKIGRRYLPFGGGIDRFRVEAGRLAFADLLARHGLAQPGRARRVVWRTYDNAQQQAGHVLADTVATDTALAVPPGEAPFLQAVLHTPGQGATTVYLRRRGGRYGVVGIERSAEAPGWLKRKT